MATGILGDITYGDLYRRWEKGNWSATEIDFSEDRRQWLEQLDDFQRRAALWNYALFLHGEASVADNLAPFIEAAPQEEQRWFLTTQQVDEARHSVFFGRFMREVVGQGDSFAGALEATTPELTWGFRQVFARLERMAQELKADPSKPRLAAGVTLYHLVIEANLAQPGQHFITSYLESRDILPGFRAGMVNVALDEQRHIGFGVKLLSELIAESEECRQASLELLREVLPSAVAVLVPPNWDRRYTECFGFTLEQIYTEGTQSLWTKLRTVGFSDEEIAQVSKINPDLPYPERARRALALVRANVLGERAEPPTPDPDVLNAFFDSMRFAVDHSATPGRPVTIQWDLTDAEPWHLCIDNGSTRAEQGRAEHADLTFRCRFEDLVDIATGKEDPRRLVARRRLKAKGSPRMLLRAPKLFAP